MLMPRRPKPLAVAGCHRHRRCRRCCWPTAPGLTTPPLQGGRSDPLSCDAWRLHRDSLASGAAPVGLVPRKDIASVTHPRAEAMPLLPDWTRPTIEHA
jgi:hypothetical protein